MAQDDDSQVSTKVLSTAIAQMQETQQLLVDAIAQLTAHDTNELAHEEIRNLIYALQEQDVMYTRDDILHLINQGILDHTTKAFDQAHSGWEEYSANLEARLLTIEHNLSVVQGKVEGIDIRTDLELAIQAIENKYAPILANLQNSFRDAEQNGSEILAQEYANAIARTLDEKKAEIMDVLEAYHQENFPVEVH